MRIHSAIRTAAVAFAMLTALASAAVKAETYHFSAITNNSGISDAVASQFSVEVTDGGYQDGANIVDFTFRNVGLTASVITGVYFDDGSLLGISSIANGTGVQFSPGASPADLPGGNSINFNTSAGFSAASDPGLANGVNPGEQVTIKFSLKEKLALSDTLAAIAYAQTDPTADLEGGLRIGIHVQSINGGTSDSFAVLPLPGPVWGGLALMGFVGLTKGIAKRRQTEA